MFQAVAGGGGPVDDGRRRLRAAGRMALVVDPGVGLASSWSAGMQHVAFIAMSGVRAASEELNRAGLTMPGFLERSQAIASLPSLALLTLAALTPDSFEVSYHEVEDIAKLGEPPACDVAAIASYSAQIKDAYRLADRYRAPGGPDRARRAPRHRPPRGGAAPCRRDRRRRGGARLAATSSPTWPAAGFAGSTGPTGREFDLADAPLPRFDLLDVERYNRLTVQTQRGCPWRCEFCAASIRLTQRYKVKPIDKVLAEIGEIKRLWPAPFIEFADDNTFVNRRHSQGPAAGAGRRAHPLVHGDRHRGSPTIRSSSS